MLEFEDVNVPEAPHVPRGELKPGNLGYVVLPVSEYNELLRRADAAFNAIKLCRREYRVDKPIEAEIDKHWLYELIMHKLHMQYGHEIYNTHTVMSDPDDMVLLDVSVAKLKGPDEEGTEDEQD